MLNLECVDKVKKNKIELCFTDSEGDECIKLLITEATAWGIVREIQRNFSYAAKNKR